MASVNQAFEPIAIVGSACRFPGGVSSPSELWDLLRQPQDVLSEIPPSRFNVDKFYHPDSNRSGTMNGTKYTRRLACLKPPTLMLTCCSPPLVPPEPRPSRL
jgi:hypothetical protein